MSAGIRLHNARLALSCLENLACFYSKAKEPPDLYFGFGLSVILGYIKNDVTAAYNECTNRRRANHEA